MRALGTLRQLAEQKAPGPSPSFTELHLAEVVEIIGCAAIGRARLSKEINLGEGATRTLISRLIDAGLATTNRRGIQLTKSGLLIRAELKRNFPREAAVPRSSITVGPHNFGILVANGGRKVTNGIEQRDAAVRAGATGAVTLLFKRRLLYVPPMERVTARDWQRTARGILNIFKPKENDAIVICGAESMRKAEEGARAAAWTLIDS